ncbi:MAG TPA: hypothetical protein VH796_18220 [Nitrososphaeraceae archaeon]|jgi:hypothetical protein
MFDDRVAAVKGISTLRQEITHLRSIIFSLRRIVYEITNDIQKFSGEDLSKYFNYLEDHINKALEVQVGKPSKFIRILILCTILKELTGFPLFS